jgi:hypothetical protein
MRELVTFFDVPAEMLRLASRYFEAFSFMAALIAMRRPTGFNWAAGT